MLTVSMLLSMQEIIGDDFMQIVDGGVSSLLNQVQEKQNTLLEKLASGKEINSASDGAAAQQIIDRLSSEVEGNRQAVNNV